MVGAAIASGVIGATQLGLSIYGNYQQQQYQDEQNKLQKRANKINYQEGLQNLDQARDTLTTNLGQEQSSLNLQWEQAQDTAQSQYEDAVAEEDSALENAHNDLADWKKETAADLSASKASAAASGVRNTGSVQRSLELQQEEAALTEDRAVTKISDETEDFSRTVESHWDTLDDYEERYNQKLANLQETYDQKMSQLDESENILTQKYKAGVAISDSQYSYATSSSWLNYASAGLDAFSTGLNTYNALSNIDWGKLFD